MTPDSHTLLIVDDDPHIREVLRYALTQEGFAVHEASNGNDALTAAQTHHPHLLILDIMMPERSGLDVCKELRKTSQTPILFLSSKDAEIDRIIGLELGGDDYVTKPFSPRELVARVKAILKRLQPQQPISPVAAPAVLTCGQITLDPLTFSVTWQQTPVTLTSTEYNLLETFLRTPTKVYTRDELVQADLFKDIVTDRTIDSHIRRLRQKFAAAGCDTAVDTVHGFGYKLGSCQ